MELTELFSCPCGAVFCWLCLHCSDTSSCDCPVIDLDEARTGYATAKVSDLGLIDLLKASNDLENGFNVVVEADRQLRGFEGIDRSECAHERANLVPRSVLGCMRCSALDSREELDRCYMCGIELCHRCSELLMLGWRNGENRVVVAGPP